jgi:hypothetical protein
MVMKNISGTINGTAFILTGKDGEYPELSMCGETSSIQRELAKRIVRQAPEGESIVGEVSKETDLHDLFRDLGVSA